MTCCDLKVAEVVPYCILEVSGVINTFALVIGEFRLRLFLQCSVRHAKNDICIIMLFVILLAAILQYCHLSLLSSIKYYFTRLVFFVLFLGGDQDKYYLEGLMESPSVDDDVDCFSPMLLNATSVNVEVYYNKAVNYTLMVTFVSFTMCVVLKFP